jgi:hypothetical protein
MYFSPLNADRAPVLPFVRRAMREATSAGVSPPAVASSTRTRIAGAIGREKAPAIRR